MKQTSFKYIPLEFLTAVFVHTRKIVIEVGSKIGSPSLCKVTSTVVSIGKKKKKLVATFTKHQW